LNPYPKNVEDKQGNSTLVKRTEYITSHYAATY
jgi:hypothetical protein